MNENAIIQNFLWKEKEDKELKGDLNNQLLTLNYADISQLVLSELKHFNKYFKSKVILLVIIEEKLKIKSNSLQFDKVKTLFHGRYLLILRSLKKSGFIKKYNNFTWEIINPIDLANEIKIFSFSPKKQAVINALKNSEVSTIEKLKKQKFIRYLNIIDEVNQINKLIPNLITIKRKGCYPRFFSFNPQLLKKYHDLI